MLGQLVRTIKEKHPDVLIQYHGHSGPGLSMASILEVCENGADIIDVAMEPMSWGKVHPDIISVQAMLKDLGFQVPDINMKAYMKARAMTQEFIDEFLGYFMDPTNKHMSSLLLKCGLPGGMMGSMMADLKGVHSGINMILRGKNEPELSLDDLLVMLFDEVEYVWPKLGYPPLVTPFSQYVKNVALMNLMQQVKGEERWTMIDNHTWDMILGKSGRLPGTLAPEIVELAKSKGFEFVDTDPQLNYPDALDRIHTGKRWTKTVGNMAMMTRNSSSLPCTTGSIATINPALPRNVLRMTCSVPRMRRWPKTDTRKKKSRS